MTDTDLSSEGPISAGDPHGRWHLQAGILCVYLGPDLKRCARSDSRAPQDQAADIAREMLH